MKAKEYFSKYNEIKAEKGGDYALVECFLDMFNEVKSIAKSRNVKFDTAMVSIFNEMNKKANVFIALVNKNIDEAEEGKVHYDGFKMFVRIKFKDLAKMISW